MSGLGLTAVQCIYRSERALLEPGTPFAGINSRRRETVHTFARGLPEWPEKRPRERHRFGTEKPRSGTAKRGSGRRRRRLEYAEEGQRLDAHKGLLRRLQAVDLLGQARQRLGVVEVLDLGDGLLHGDGEALVRVALVLYRRQAGADGGAHVEQVADGPVEIAHAGVEIVGQGRPAGVVRGRAFQRVGEPIQRLEDALVAARLDGELVARRRRAADADDDAGELDGRTRLEAAGGHQGAGAVGHFPGVVGDEADGVGVPAPGGRIRHRAGVDDAGAGVAGGRGGRERAVAPWDALEHARAGVAVGDAPPLGDLDEALALVAVVQGTVGGGAERLHLVAVAGEQITPGGVLGVGDLDHLILELADLGGDERAGLVALGAVARLHGQLAGALQQVAGAGQRLLFHRQAALRQVAVTVELLDARGQLPELDAARRADRIVRRREQPLAAGDLLLGAGERRLQLLHLTETRPEHACGGYTHQSRLLAAERPDQGLEQGVGHADQLGGRLIGLLIAHQVGGLLVQVHARLVAERLFGVLAHNALGLEADLRLAADGAHLGDQTAVALGHGDGAARQQTPGLHLGQTERVAVIARTAGIGLDAEDVPGRGRAGDDHPGAVDVDRVAARIGEGACAVDGVGIRCRELDDGAAEQVRIAR